MRQNRQIAAVVEVRKHPRRAREKLKA